MQVLGDMGAFTRKWRPEEMVKPECFYAECDEEWKVMEKYDRSKSVSQVQ